MEVLKLKSFCCCKEQFKIPASMHCNLVSFYFLKLMSTIFFKLLIPKLQNKLRNNFYTYLIKNCPYKSV